MSFIKRLPLWAALLSSLLLAACAATASRLAVPYAVTLVAAQDVNSGGRYGPSPIKVTVYELRSTNAFELTDFFALQKDAQAALGDQLLNVRSVILRPGQTERITSPSDVEATAIGIVAAYRDLDGSQWRLTLPLPESRKTNIYKVWQFSPRQAKITINVEKAGLSIPPQ